VSSQHPLRPWVQSGLDDAQISRQWSGIVERLDRTPQARWSLGMAIVIGAIGFGALGVGLSRLPQVHPHAASATAGGSVLVLADGSRVTLDDAAKLEMPINEPAHVVASLERGSALFEVGPDPDHERSFTVIAGDVEVRVVGAQLRVDHEPASHAVTTAVVRGDVEVRNAAEPGEVHRLGAGEAWSAPRVATAQALSAPAGAPAGAAAASEPGAGATTPRRAYLPSRRASLAPR
jgi:transmembrane sensor